MNLNLKKNITALFLAVLMVISFSIPAIAANDEREQIAAEELMYQNNTPYRGEGMVVAILDNSFNLETEHWTLTDESAAKITEATIKGVKDKLNAKTFYYHNSKIPFVYNYSNDTTTVTTYDIHGTHIAGVIGANDKDAGTGFTGIVPEAQLLFMAIFSSDGSSNTEVLVAAIQDAVTLGADVINMSVGVIAGLEDGYPFGSELSEAIVAAEAAGVSVVCAVGNSGNNYGGSYYSDAYAIDLATVDVIDNGTIATPATIDTTIAVGSLAADYGSYYYITLNDENHTMIKYTDTTDTEIVELGSSFTELFDGQTLEYVVVPGLGTAEDYEGIDVTGKLALIQRGELTFVEKLQNAEAAGAIGAIVYNNVTDEGADVNMAIAGANIPAIFISLDDGLLMADDSVEDKSVTINDNTIYYFPSENQGLPLLSTSIGPTPNLTLKPDVMAVGSNVLSLAATDDMRRLTGTSMSAGCVSGIATMLKQYLRENDMPDDSAYVRTLLINSAVPSLYEDTLFSPRIQGGGKINIETMLNTEVVITGTDGRAKIELGDNLANTFKIDYTITNVTGDDLTVTLKSALLTDDYVTFDIEDDTTLVKADKNMSDIFPYFINDVNTSVPSAAMYIDTRYTNINIYSPSYKEYQIKLKAGESRNLTLSVYLNDNFIKENSKVFTNGFFLDGYIFAEVAESGSVSSIPFMGFYGDWANLNVIDTFSYDGDASYFKQSYLYTYMEYAGVMVTWQAGRHFTDDDAMPLTRHIAFSPNFDDLADEIYISMSLLRTGTLKYMALTDGDGNVIDQIDESVIVQKSVMSSDYFNIFSMGIWSGDDGVNPMYIYPDGEYYLTITVQPVYGDADEQTLTIPIILDTEIPKMVSYEVTETDEGRILKIDCTDNHCIQAASFYDKFAGIYHDINHSHDIDEECGIVEFSIGIDEFIENGTRYIYIDIYDYAFNSATVRIDLMEYIS